jgi:hypothetical protein
MQGGPDADESISIASKRSIMAMLFVFSGALSLPPILLNMPEALPNLKLSGVLLVAMLGGIAVALLIISLCLASYPLIRYL